MRKFALFLLLVSTFLFGVPEKVRAAGVCGGLPAQGLDTTLSFDTKSHKITKNFSSYEAGKKYQLVIYSAKLGVGRVDEAFSPEFVLGESRTYSAGLRQNGTVTVNGSVVSWTFDATRALTNDNLTFANEDPHFVYLYRDPPIWDYVSFSQEECLLGSYNTSKSSTANICDVFVWQERGGKQCYASGEESCLEGGSVTTNIEVKNIRNENGQLYSGETVFQIGEKGGGVALDQVTSANQGNAQISIKSTSSAYTINVRVWGSNGLVNPACAPIEIPFTQTCNNLCANRGTLSQMQMADFELCAQVGNNEQFEKCQACLAGETEDGGGKPHVWTAIGCIPTAPTGIIQTLIRLALGLGGGVTLLLILAGAFRLSVSQGDPKAAEEAKEQITSAVIGLLFIIFSVVMLRFVGVQVLQIPGFGS